MNTLEQIVEGAARIARDDRGGSSHTRAQLKELAVLVRELAEVCLRQDGVIRSFTAERPQK
jgi:hypothetical protein